MTFLPDGRWRDDRTRAAIVLNDPTIKAAEHLAAAIEEYLYDAAGPGYVTTDYLAWALHQYDANKRSSPSLVPPAWLAGATQLDWMTPSSDYFYLTAVPDLATTDPTDAQLGIAVSKVISITLNKGMDPTTLLAAVLVEDEAAPVAATPLYNSSTGILTITPTTVWTTGDIHTVTIADSAEDVFGNVPAGDLVFTFTVV